MISIEEIKEKQEELNKMIDELEKKNFKWDKNWKPKIEDNYYCINSCGDVERSNWLNDMTDNYRRKCLRIFQTKEQAEKWLEIDTYLREKSFEPDWKDEYQNIYFLAYDYCTNRFIIDCHSFFCNFEPFYFETKEIVQEILEKYTTKELKFYFNIGE